VIVQEAICGLLRPKVLYRVRPKDITHQTLRWRFAESIELCGAGSVIMTKRRKTEKTYVSDIVESVEFWRETTVDTEELFVHHGR
jgi:hypothetical protein